MKRHLPLPMLLIASLSAWSPLPASATDGAEPALGVKHELVFSDDFERQGLGPNFKTGIPAFEVSDGVLRGTQQRADHGSSVGAKLPLPSGDVFFEMQFRFEGARSINVNFDDKGFQGVHAGHISRVVIRPPVVILTDDKEGVMRNDIRALLKSGDPKKKAEGDRMAENAMKKFPVELEQGRWYKIAIEIVGDQMRVTIDDALVGSLQSPGLAHLKKPDLRIGVWGQDQEALIDNLRVWSVTPIASTDVDRLQQR